MRVSAGMCYGLYLTNTAHARSRRAADCHARLQVVDYVADDSDEDEEEEDDDEDDEVALHGCDLETPGFRDLVCI